MAKVTVKQQGEWRMTKDFKDLLDKELFQGLLELWRGGCSPDAPVVTEIIENLTCRLASYPWEDQPFPTT